MKPYVVIATKGRANIAYEVLTSLKGQSIPMEHIVFVGSEPSDLAGLETHPMYAPETISLILSDAGLTKQRNAGLDFLSTLTQEQDPNDWFVAFFDDDFRLASNWMFNCKQAFLDDPALVGVGGCVLADGITTDPISESAALEYIASRRPPMKHTWSGARREVPDLYGCNMAYRGSFAKTGRFDPDLPSYGWLEDVDYSVRAGKTGALRLIPECRGVHLGTSSGRTSGIRFGYSQIANPLYLIKKGGIPVKKGSKTMLRNLLSNGKNSFFRNPSRDYVGRLRGNIMAIRDLFLGSCHPTRIIDIQ